MKKEAARPLQRGCAASLYKYICHAVSVTATAYTVLYPSVDAGHRIIRFTQCFDDGIILFRGKRPPVRTIIQFE